MLVTVNNQAYIFLCIVFGGMFIGLIYDFFRVSRKAIKTRNIIVHFEDILFWMMVSILIFGILFVCNAGEIRGYALLAIILGVIIYEFLFSHYVVIILLKIIDVIKKITRFLFKIIRIPIKIFIRILRIPTKFLTQKLRKLFNIISKIKNGIIHRVKLNVKNLKNTIKKY